MEVRGVEPLIKLLKSAVSWAFLKIRVHFRVHFLKNLAKLRVFEALFRAFFLFVYYALRSCKYTIIFWHSKSKKACRYALKVAK